MRAATVLRGLAPLLLAGWLTAGDAVAAEPPRLERVVIVMRHGVRPPTKPAEALASLSDRPWPGDRDWGAGPGELTPHGAEAIRRMGRDLRQRYGGLIAASVSVFLWADGADQRTRETARVLGEALSPGAPIAASSRPKGDPDPLFDALAAGACRVDPDAALAAVRAQEPLQTPATRAALARLQAIVAPRACDGGPGVCLSGADEATANAKGIKLDGPLGTGASLAEDLLLEYENGLPAAQVGWGRMGRADLDVVLAAHVRSSDLTRRSPYVARRRAAPLARFVLDALAMKTPAASASPVVVLVGHDTNLANLAGVFGLDWRLPGQPDPTAPGTALVFERWRGADGPELRVRVLYQDPDQVRRLSSTPAHEVEVRSAACGADGCALPGLDHAVRRDLDDACPEPVVAGAGASRRD